jgi:hypothetical protein
MARKQRLRPHEVHITKHGYERYVERMERMGAEPLKIKRLRLKIKGRLNDKIGKGIGIESGIAVRIEVAPGLDAILKLDLDGWVVLTFVYWHELAVVGLGA